MLRHRKNISYGLAAVVLLFSQISLFGVPDFEILYSPEPSQRICHKRQCITLYRMSIGNTGSMPQQEVRIRLAFSEDDEFALPIKVMNFGKVPRPVKISKVGQETFISLGSMEVGKRVDLTFSLLGDRQTVFPDWEKILVNVTPSTGEVAVGHPEATRFARFLYGFAQAF